MMLKEAAQSWAWVERGCCRAFSLRGGKLGSSLTPPGMLKNFAAGLALIALGWLFSGCATCSQPAGRPFVFGQDHFSFTNELTWSYEFKENGQVVMRAAEPPPTYPLRCFPMTRLTREFFYHARFAPDLPKLEPAEYSSLAQQIAERNSRCPSVEAERVVIPGFTNLFDFSRDRPELLREVVGGPVRSYFQRGNWRMIFPIFKPQRENTSERLSEEIREGRLPIVHVYRFPDVKLNHSILLYAVEEEEGGLLFRAYDPNNAHRPAELRFERERGVFVFERNQYFAGGPVQVYEVYRGWCY